MAYSSKFKSKPVTDIFNNDTCINRRNCSRQVPMKVLILGLGRTGTACSYTLHNLAGQMPIANPFKPCEPQ